MERRVLLQVEGLGKRIHGLEILREVSFSVAEGERRAIIGPNGAGKTTLFKLIAGELARTRGRILYRGQDISDLPDFRRAALGIMRTFQRTNLFNELTVLDNLLLVLQRKRGVFRNGWKTRAAFRSLYDEAGALLSAWGLKDCQHRQVRQLSYGEQRQVELLMGVAMEPRLLLLDEPTAGMSPAETRQMLERLQALPRTVTVLLIEHDMDVVFGLADRVTVLHNGGVLVEGDPTTVRSDSRVHEIYFGREGTAVC